MTEKTPLPRSAFGWWQKVLLIIFGITLSLLIVVSVFSVREIQYFFRRLSHNCETAQQWRLELLQRLITGQVEMVPCLEHVYKFNLPDEVENLILYNAYGFNDSDWEFNNPKAQSILILGDSLAHGNEVSREDGFPYLIEKKLGVEVYNLGVQAMDTSTEIELYATFGQELQAEYVLLALYLGNDVYGNYFITRELDRNEQGDWVITRPQLQRDPALYPDSPAYQWFAGLPSDESLAKNSIQASSGALYDLALPAWQDAHYFTEDLIFQLQELVAQENSKLLVVLIPDVYNVPPRIWPCPQEDTECTFRPPVVFQRYTENLTEQGIPTLNLYPHFVQWNEAHPDKELYFFHDGHLNQRGHRMTADLIAEWIADSVFPQSE